MSQDLENGRVNQKKRTREALLHAAAELMKLGRPFSIADAADFAEVSRATAYRYFPTPESLTTHAALWRVTARENAEFDRSFPADENAAERVDRLVVASDRITNDHQPEFRAMLRLALESDERIEGRPRLRHEALTRALGNEKKTLGKARFERLVSALTLTLGMEAQIVLEDVCGLGRNKALDVKRWAAQALLRAAFEEAGEH